MHLSVIVYCDVRDICQGELRLESRLFVRRGGGWC